MYLIQLLFLHRMRGELPQEVREEHAQPVRREPEDLGGGDSENQQDQSQQFKDHNEERGRRQK